MLLALYAYYFFFSFIFETETNCFNRITTKRGGNVATARWEINKETRSGLTEKSYINASSRVQFCSNVINVFYTDCIDKQKQ